MAGDDAPCRPNALRAPAAPRIAWRRFSCYNSLVCRSDHHEFNDMSSTSPARRNLVSDRLAKAEALCRQRGKRLTPIRRKVLEILLLQGRSVKAYELLDQIRHDQPNAAPPTVYRALDFLIEEGLIHRLDAVNAWSACHDAGGTPHDLLVICTRCGIVAELNDPELGRELAQKVQAAGFVPAHHETELRALCATCHAEHGHGHGHGHGHAH